MSRFRNNDRGGSYTAFIVIILVVLAILAILDGPALVHIAQHR